MPRVNELNFQIAKLLYCVTCSLNGASTAGIDHDCSSLKRLLGHARNVRAVNLIFVVEKEGYHKRNLQAHK